MRLFLRKEEHKLINLDGGIVLCCDEYYEYEEGGSSIGQVKQMTDQYGWVAM